MELFDKLGSIAKNIGEKTGEVFETSKLSLAISSEKKDIGLRMQKIGEFYYAKYKAGEVPPQEIAEHYTAIDGHFKAIENAQAEIDKIRDSAGTAKAESDNPVPCKIICSSCGTTNAEENKFCAQCGAKLGEPKPATP